MRSLSFSPLGDMLAGGGAGDTRGLSAHKTRGSEMKVVIWRVALDNAQSDRTGLIFFDDMVRAFALPPCGKQIAEEGQDKGQRFSWCNISRKLQL